MPGGANSVTMESVFKFHGEYSGHAGFRVVIGSEVIFSFFPLTTWRSQCLRPRNPPLRIPHPPFQPLRIPYPKNPPLHRSTSKTPCFSFMRQLCYFHGDVMVCKLQRIQDFKVMAMTSAGIRQEFVKISIFLRLASKRFIIS